MTEDEILLIECDSMLSLIRYREKSGLSNKTMFQLELLCRKVRMRTDQIIRDVGVKVGTVQVENQKSSEIPTRRPTSKRRV